MLMQPCSVPVLGVLYGYVYQCRQSLQRSLEVQLKGVNRSSSPYDWWISIHFVGFRLLRCVCCFRQQLSELENEIVSWVFEVQSPPTIKSAKIWRRLSYL